MSRSVKEILTQFQQPLLKTIGRSPLASDFYLTGGTALAAFFLRHRQSEDGEPVKLDFAQDTPFRLMSTTHDQQFGLQIDSAIDIASNKLAALLGRAAAKDFVDVYFIHRPHGANRQSLN